MWGTARLESLRAHFVPFDPEQENAALFAGYLAQWVDIGFQRSVLVKEMVARFSKSVRSRLPLHDYVYLRLTEGMSPHPESRRSAKNEPEVSYPPGNVPRHNRNLSEEEKGAGRALGLALNTVEFGNSQAHCLD